MIKSKQNLTRLIGIVGTLVCIGWFIKSPSFLTPDKLIVVLTFVFMIFNQAWPMLKRLLPFVLLLLAYESFRSVADSLNHHVDYSFAPAADRALFGNLPTIYFQNWLWHGHVRWFDMVLYVPYMLHFVLPLIFALIIWKRREAWYWRFVGTYLVVSFGAFVTFLAFPTAPPWMASDQHLIPHIQRISSDVWFAFGLHNFPSFYNHIAPNPVAAVPSLHAAWSLLFVIFVWRLFGRRWGMISIIYPLMIWFGTIYEGEHYAIDVIIGIIYALAAYWLTPKILAGTKRAWLAISRRWHRA